MDIPERTTYFLAFNDQYQNISSYGIWAHITYDQLIKEEIDKFGIKLSEFSPMTLNHLIHRIKHIDYKYPWSMSPNILLAISLISLFMRLIVVGYFLYRMYKVRSHLRSLNDFKNFLNGTADVSKLNDLRTQLKRLLSPVDLEKLLPKGGPTTTPKTQEEHPPTPPPRPSISHYVIPLQDLPSSKSVEYAVAKLGDKGLDVKKYRAFLQKHMLSKTASHT